MADPVLWMVRAGRGADLVQDFRSENVVAIGWSEVGRFPYDIADNELKTLFERAYPDERPTTRIVWQGMVKRFIREMQVGDQVLTYDPDERLYYLGTINSPAEWREDPFPRFRRVTWRQQIPRDSLSANTRNRLGSIATFFKIGDDAAREVRQTAVPLGTMDIPVPAVAGPSSLETDEEIPSEDALRDEVVSKSEEFIEDALAALSWSSMQELVAGILRAMGYRTQVSPPGADRGTDIFASPDGLGLEEPRIFVEVKHRRGSAMGSDEIRAFLGGRRTGDRCLYVSTGGFTKDARYEADRANVPLRLINMADLRALLVQFYEKIDPATQALVPLRRLYWPIDRSTQS